MKNSSEITYSHEWIYKLENRGHWILYWHQLNLILNKSDLSKEAKIIEIGVGSGLTSGYLRRKGYHVTTLDIDENKKPDIHANIVEDELPAADVYLAFEIFEHIPFESAKKVWKTLAQNRVKKLFFSIPHAYKTYFFAEFYLPRLGKKTIHIGRKRNYIHTKNHHWELDINQITTDSIKHELSGIGYTIDYSYRYRNHHFFAASLI